MAVFVRCRMSAFLSLSLAAFTSAALSSLPPPLWFTELPGQLTVRCGQLYVPLLAWFSCGP